MMLILKNIKQLVQVNTNELVRGKEMATLNTIDNAWLCMHHGKIDSFGAMDNFPKFTEHDKVEIKDVSGKYVMPCWCDSHTHIVFAGPRHSEFVDRIKGLSYEQIAANGGGILNSALLLNQTTEEELLESAYHRLRNMIHLGTGAIEIKSGYGLTVEGELKMLRVIQQLKQMTNVIIKSNFLGAHAIPLQYKNNRQAYIDLIIDKMLPIVAEEKLADFIDVFCDRGFYTIQELEQILEAGIKYGLTPKIHANQLDNIGAVQVAVKYGAASVDHCEHITHAEIDSLLPSQTIPTLLPSAAFFLGLNYQPARFMIDSGLPIALATDYNPGSSPSGSMPFVLSLACIKLKMTPAEAINAATINSAYAMKVNNIAGSISKGKAANVFVTNKIPSLDYIPYSFTENCIEQVYIKGKLV
nr:imidazolonepropionase [Bacteroidota bacterium]